MTAPLSLFQQSANSAHTSQLIALRLPAEWRGTTMKAWRARRGIAKACLFAGVIAMSGACYAFGVYDGADGQRVRAREDRIIGIGQKPAFLAYVERRQMRSASMLGGVSVGDVLPQEGVTYYDIPLRFGAGLNRCAIIAGKALIVDASTRRVVEVIE